MTTVNRVFIRGDTHSDFSWLPQWCEENQTTTNDILIILGDSALRFEGADNWREKNRKKKVAAQPITIFCVRGNHDRPYYKEDGTEWEDIQLENCPLLEQTIIGDLKVYDNEMWHDPNYPNIWYFQDGGHYKIKDKTFFVYGGAFSVDWEYRRLMGWTWYPNEMVSRQRHIEILDIIDHQHFNFILTHTCPYEWRPTDLFLSCIDQSKVDNTMEERLTEVEQYVGGYDAWFWGHYHANRDYGYISEYDWNGTATMLFDKVRKIL